VEGLEARQLLANAGSLDPTFGAAGEVFTRATDSRPQAIGIDAAAGNKILLARATQILDGQQQPLAVPIYQVQRLNVDGSVDTTFGANGLVTLALPSPYVANEGTAYSSNTQPAAVFATSTGRIEVVGTVTSNTPGGVRAFIAALNPDGSPVAGFGVAGVSVLPTPNFRAVAAVTQGDGVLVLGDTQVSENPQPTDPHPAVLRATAAGQLDPTFGANGVANLALNAPGSPPSFENSIGFGVDGQGRVAVAAVSQSVSQAEVFRLTRSGQPDPTFAGTGSEALPLNTFFATTAVAAQPDGKVVLTGSPALIPGSTAPRPTETLRLNADGTVDTSHTFDVTTQPLYVIASAIQPDGKILLAGKGATSVVPGGIAPATGPYAVVRLNADLTPDATFGTANGEVTFNDPVPSGGTLNALIVDPSGNILVAGNNSTLLRSGARVGGSLVARLIGVATPTQPPLPSADLAVSEVDSAGPAAFPGSVTLTVTVANNGPNDATNVVVTDTLPAFATFNRATPGQGSPAVVSQDQKTLTDNLGTIPAGGSASLTIVITPANVVIPPLGAATLFNTASVTSALPDLILGNNTLTHAVTIPPTTPVDLVVTQVTSTPVARYGQVELFVVTVTNRGVAAASGVVLDDAFPANAVLLNVGPTQGTVRSVANGQAIVDIGTLAPGASASVFVVVVPNATGAVINRAVVVASAPNLNNSLTILGVLAVDGPVVQGITRASNGSSAVVSFDEALDPTSARQRGNYRVVDLGLRSLGRTTGRTVATRSVTYTPGSRAVQVNTAGRLNPTHQYTLILGGSAPRGLLDASGRRIVGNGSGLAGPAQANPF